jgi:hypothetical protein
MVTCPLVRGHRTESGSTRVRATDKYRGGATSEQFVTPDGSKEVAYGDDGGCDWLSVTCSAALSPQTREGECRIISNARVITSRLHDFSFPRKPFLVQRGTDHLPRHFEHDHLADIAASNTFATNCALVFGEGS